MRIAVDAMGGDDAPKAIVEGVLLAQKKHPELKFLLFGDETKIKSHLTNETNITVIHTDEKIESDDEPVRAIRRKKKASMVLAAQAVKDNEADALFSAGNTGALMAAGLFVIGRIKGIDRPGFMPILPVIGSEDGFCLIDAGANADNKPEHLAQFAVLASYYAKNVQHKNNPKVGLLNNGTEEGKGSQLTKDTFELLKEIDSINFIGNIEARDLLNGVADVVVTDGFTGNAVLKTIEGTAMSMMSLLKSSIVDSGVKGKLGALMLKDGLMNMKNQMDYSQYGGAVMIGISAPVIKTHGSTGPEAVAVTITQIKEMLETRVIEELVDYFEKKPKA